MSECAEGRLLLDLRDAALTATQGIMIGKITTAPETPEERARWVEYSEAVQRVHDPAIHYNGHVALCKQCQVSPPIGPYSKVE